MTVDTRNHNVGAGCLVQVDFFSKTLRAAFIESLALNWLIVAEIVVDLSLIVAQRHQTAEVNILALKLHGEQLLFHLFLDGDEAWLLALHGALSSFFGKFVEANLVESLLTLLALPRLNQDGLTKGTE